MQRPPNAPDFVANKVCARKSHDTAIDGTQKVGGRPGQELRFAIPSGTKRRPARRGLPHRAAEERLNRRLVANDDLSRFEQVSHLSLTSLKIGGFAGHIQEHDAPLSFFGLLVLFGVDR